MKTRIIQNLPSQFHLRNSQNQLLPLNDPNVYLWFWDISGHKKAGVVKPDGNKSAKEVALDKVIAAEKAGVPVYATAPIPCNNGQQGVFAFSAAGDLMAFVSTTVNDKVKKAKDSLFQVASSEEEPKNMQKVDPMMMIVKVKYDGSQKPYTFRCRKAHKAGDRVCVHTCEEYKNVTVIGCYKAKDSEIRKYAKSIGYDDLTWLYCEYGVDLRSFTERM